MNSLESHVLRLVGENVSSPDVFTDTDEGMTQIRTSINAAIQEMCMVTGSYVQTVHLPLLVGQQWYKLYLRQDYLGYIVQVWDRNRHTKLAKTDILTLSREDPYWMKDSGYPMQYLQVGQDYFGIYMKPSASGVVLELKCVCIPQPYEADTDPVKVRENYQNAAAYFATGEFYASRGDAGRATEYHKQYLQVSGLMGLHPQEQERVHQLGTNGGNGKPWQRFQR